MIARVAQARELDKGAAVNRFDLWNCKNDAIRVAEIVHTHMGAT
eukprot:CAMPEP_0117483146 /NCGR_PEP_ID=MMETSP0784-20121206/13786_1 /TAXON_ID=39447 /ORGANISM="" /LENGTH=43 /DNA_ID= /DNA_START= /DNA_END= /DNA_ORIENTATION=